MDVTMILGNPKRVCYEGSQTTDRLLDQKLI